MTPFEGLPFFLLLTVLLAGAAVLGLCRVSLRWYGLGVTLLMALAVFRTPKDLAMLAGFWLWETAAVFAYLAVRKKCAKRPLLWLFLLFGCAPLLTVKLSGLFPALRFFHLLGVSYMTFRTVQVLIEIYDGQITALNAGMFSYFLLFFPSLSSGPIDRYRRFCKDFESVPDRETYIGLLKSGVWQLMTGALLNFVLGGLVWQKWLANVPETGFFPTLSYMYGYTLFLYFNFAGYSRMAVGASNILGVRVPENFRLPFLSRDMKDFWSRWHISLSTWLRDYVYTRFVAASLRGEWFRDKRTGSYIGYFLTMMTMGLWHGLTPAYILYGAYHGALLCLNDLLDTRCKKYKKLKKKPAFEVLSVLVTFHLFAFGLLIFSGRIV